jgi:ribosomal protein S18 acetylase RimI-like enzyme
MSNAGSGSRREPPGLVRPRSPWHVREFDAGRDSDAVTGLDASYISDQIYAVHRSGDVVALAPTSLAAPHSECLAIDLGCAPWMHGRVAALDDGVHGFAGWGYDAHNRRMTIWHCYIDRPYRRRGAARSLLDAALGWARQAGALTAWLETSSANYPAITACRRLGFEICGFDATRYRGTPHRGEVAVYLARPIDSDARS